MNAYTADVVGDLRRVVESALALIDREREQHDRERESWAEERRELTDRVRAVEADYTSASATLAEMRSAQAGSGSAGTSADLAVAEREARIEALRWARDVARHPATRWVVWPLLGAAAAAAASYAPDLGASWSQVLPSPPGVHDAP